MTAPAFNLHATAIVLGARGFLFVGQSGAGKTMLALSCMASARKAGLFSALVSDDQVLISFSADRPVARAPAAIAGLAEIRGAGIVPVETIDAAVIDYAILPSGAPFEPRMPPQDERFLLGDNRFLPLFRLPYGAGMEPFENLKRILPPNDNFADGYA